MSLEFLKGWSGITWEPVWQCDYCGHRVSEPTGPLNREAKRTHRESCTTPPELARTESAE